MRHIIAGLAFCSICFAQKPDARIGRILNDLAATRSFEEVAISPDGRRVAWVEEIIENGRDTGKSAIYVENLIAKASTRISGKTAASERGIAWSPDGSQIAFLSDRDRSGQMQVYVTPWNGGQRARKLTSLKGFLTDPQWSPNGSRIAVLFAENAPSGGGPLEAEPIETGVIGSATHNQRLTTIEAVDGTVKQVSPAGLNVYEYDWSPDGKKFALSAAPGPGDNNWWIAKLYTMPFDNGTMTELYTPETEIAMPRWSPDGATIGFIQGLMSDESITGGDLFTVPAAGGEAQNRTPGRKSSISSIQWTSPSQLVATEWAGGSTAISTIDVATGQGERLWQGDENVHVGGYYGNFSIARDGRTSAVIRNNWDHAPEIWTGRVGDWTQQTDVNSRHERAWGHAKNIEWTNDGFKVQGFLLYPKDFDESKKYPMVVSIHGGPAYLNYPHWPGAQFDLSILSALGYFVFFPNPRGSYGQGEAFTRANVKDFGGGDLRDILAGLDAVLAIAPVDENRIGVSGWSYGGYMTMWAVTQTNRFKAAVAGAGIANWQSYYGENSIDRWMIPYFGKSVYDDPSVYAKSAPITFIKDVKTPTLVVVGERDGECPAPQSYEFWHALNTLGISTELVVYPGEGHAFRQPDHKRDVMERTAEWFEKYLR